MAATPRIMRDHCAMVAKAVACNLRRLACGCDKPNQKNIKQRRGHDAQTQERKAGRVKMSPSWWARAAWRFCSAASTDRKKIKMMKKKRQCQLLVTSLKTQVGQLKIRKPLPVKKSCSDSSPLGHSRESCAELADSRLPAVCPRRPQAELLGNGGGDGAANMRSRIAAKLSKTDFAAAASRVVAQLWELDQPALREVRGSPDQVREQIAKLCKQHRVQWNGDDSAQDDKVWEQDPWSKWSKWQHSGTSSSAGHKQTEQQQTRMEKIEIKTSFITNDGLQIPHRPLADLEAATAGEKTCMVVCVAPSELKAAIKAAQMVKGSVVLLLRSPPSDTPVGAVQTMIQAVTRNSSMADWKASQWCMLVFSDCPVEAALQGIELKMGEASCITMLATLREEHTEENEFVRFVKADSLQVSCGLGDVFKVQRMKCWGQSPHRVATKMAMVSPSDVEKVMQASGLSQVSIGFDLIAEERARGHATHIIEEVDTVKVRKSLEGIRHLGVTHIRNRKCLIRVEAKYLAEVRKVLSPGDPRFSLAPEINVTSKWRVLAVPLKISPLKLSAALLHQLNWRQVPLGSVKREPKKDIHQVLIGSSTGPPVDVIIVEKAVCVIRADRPEVALPDAQPRILPYPEKHDEPMHESPVSCAQALTEKVQLEIKCAGEAIRGQANQQATSAAGEVEKRLQESMQAKFADLDKRMSAVEAATSSVTKLTSECATMATVVQQIQRDQAKIEPLIETKVMEAAQTTATQLASTLNGKFDELGKQLFAQISGMAKKREAEDVDTCQARLREERAAQRGVREGGFYEHGQPCGMISRCRIQNLMTM